MNSTDRISVETAWRGYGNGPAATAATTPPPAPAPSAALPDEVYVPAHPDPSRPDRALEFEVRQLADGSLALPAFTSLDQLALALGPAQPWARMPLRAARALMTAAGIPTVVLDPQSADSAWRWTEEDIVELAKVTK